MAGLPNVKIKKLLYQILRDHYTILRYGIGIAIFLIIICSFLQFKAFSYVRSHSFAMRLSQAPADTVMTALVHMNVSVDTARYFGNRAKLLKHISKQTKNHQKNLKEFLHAEKAKGNIIRFRPFWIVNAFLVEGKSHVLRTIQQRTDVSFLQENYILSIPEIKKTPYRSGSVLHEWGIEKINVSRVWEAYGYTGKNIRIGHLDTGVDPSHPDIKGKIALWVKIDGFGTVLEDSEPYDSNNHGTHTAGILVGGNAGGTSIGVAPEAELLSAMVVNNGIGTFAQVLAGIEWIIDPDGDPSTDDGADILNLSLGMSGQNEDFIEPVNKLIAADIFPAFAIGNAGPDSSMCPGNIPVSFAVGAIEDNDEVAYFSSGEIVTWNIPPFVGQWTKPDITAPGVNIKSSVPGGYSWFSGTSMAAPFCAGTVALIKQANPNLSVSQIKTILCITAQDYEEPGKDTRYGWGILDAYKAVTLAISGDLPDGISEYDSGLPVAYIISPKENQTLFGDAVTIIAGATNNTSKVIFQYQEAARSSDDSWITIGQDTKPPFSVYWNVKGLTKGYYRIRAVPSAATPSADRSHDGINSSPVFSGVVVKIDDNEPDIFEWGGTEVNPLAAHEKTERIDADTFTEIMVADGTTVIIPAHTLTAPAELHIRHLEPQEIYFKLPPPESSLKPVGIFREFTLSDGTYNFSDDITIFLPYVDDDDDGFIDGTSILANNLRIFYLREDASGNPVQWVEISTDEQNSSLKNVKGLHRTKDGYKGMAVNVNHFSLFAIMAQEQKDNLNEVYVYPNPVRPNQAGNAKTLTFTNLSRDVTVRIFTLAGRLVRKVEHMADPYTWDLRNDSGEHVQSGVYFYVVTDSNEHKATGKFAIIR